MRVGKAAGNPAACGANKVHSETVAAEVRAQLSVNGSQKLTDVRFEAASQPALLYERVANGFMPIPSGQKAVDPSQGQTASEAEPLPIHQLNQVKLKA